MPAMMTPIRGPEIEKFISKCAVCESPTRAIVMHTDSGGQGAGQSLVSPGSCLKDFRSRPFIECHGQGRCNYYSTSLSYWMATIREEDQFRRPVPQTLKAGDQKSRISRCTVCMRRPPDRMLPLQQFLGDYDSDYAADQSYSYGRGY